jgi:outer membrane protein OmpA-like peptidoglycan-associated protein
MRFVLASVIGLLMAFGPSVRAQSPTADSIINSLKPRAGDLQQSTRGIRPARAIATPETTTAPPSERAPALAPAPGPDELSVKLSVAFRTGSADLTSGATRTLSELGKALTSKDLSNFRFRIEGHTDTVGKKEENQALSQKRAETVAAYLVKQFGISADRLQAVGVGSEELIVQTPDQTPEARNRVVKVINLGA